MCQGEASFSYYIQGQYVPIFKRNEFLLRGRAVFYCSYKSLQETQLPTNGKNSSQILIISSNKLIVLFKLYKGNHRVQSKISEVSFSIEFRFETIVGCFVTILHICTQLFVHTFSHFIMTPDHMHQIYCGKDPTFTQPTFFLS